ncbi:MAG: hypothetical protein IPF38_13760 [Burkholderiales bacterium]|jgi:hypothetical protein|nr:hypothetical protein [Burkholderiales bacterium]
MFEFLGRHKSKGGKTAPDHGPSTMPQTVQSDVTQRDLARLTLHHILKGHGIPADWVTADLAPVHVPGQGDALLMQLEIMHWHDALVLHAPTLQQEMLDGLLRFDPTSNSAHYLFTWKFSPDCGCPHTHMPDPDFWIKEGALQAAKTAPAANIPVDLPTSNENDDDDHGFAPTQIPDPG